MKKDPKVSISKLVVKTRFSSALTKLQNDYYPDSCYKSDLLELFEILHWYEPQSTSEVRALISDMFEQFMSSQTIEYTIEESKNIYNFFKRSVMSFIESIDMIDDDWEKVVHIFNSIENNLGL